MKATAIIIFLSAVIYNTASGQVINENFNSGLPSSWTQGNGGVSWSSNSNLGVGSSGCAMANFSSSSGQASNWLQSPFVNLTTLTNPEITFSLALIGNNTVAPNISLWYDNGSGWQQLSSWGGAGSATSATQTFDNMPPLNSTNVSWVNASFDLTQVANNTNIRFSFGADFSNGGWVLLDNVLVQSGQAPTVYNLPYTQDFENTTFIPTDWESFGAGNASWQRSSSVGGFGTSSSCMFFDNYSNSSTIGNFYGLRCVPLNLAGSTKPTLEFDVAYAQRPGTNSDRLGIWYSFNGSTGWNNLQNYNNAALTTASPTASSFVPNNTQWKKIRLDLTQFNTASYIRFAFENNSSGGNIVYVDNVHFFDDNATVGINDLQHSSEQIQLYPNPSSGKFQIKVKKAAYVSIHNIVGKKLNEQSINNGQINISNLPEGLYLIYIMNNAHQTIGVAKVWKTN